MASGSGLQVIALISGGKDSLFSILHCLANGHEVVALGNLFPGNVVVDSSGQQEENEQDTDSYMFQTVGHSVVDLYEDALGIPIYRRPLTGRAVDDSLNYTPGGVQQDEQDEAEDLHLLLQDIKKQHPDANAVCTGAILSTYQRMRVESVALRLGLIPLSYLWQYPYLPPHRDTSLLEDMQNVGMDCRLIKVASGGLDESFLNQTVHAPSVVKRMRQRMKRFEPAIGAILGEGGEFETLALAGPRPLWKKRIVLSSTACSSGEGGSHTLLIQHAVTSELESSESRSHAEILRVPSLLDSEFQGLLMDNSPFDDVSVGDARYTNGQSFESFDTGLKPISATPQTVEGQRRRRIYNFRGSGSNAFEQMTSIATSINQQLAHSVVSTILLLRDMTDFQAVNLAYSKLFTFVLPPARVTVAVGDLLPTGCDVMLSLRVCESTSVRQGLHVQSRSYWAPANIGPYSQAILEPLQHDVQERSFADARLVHVAGQIPLVPASMNSLDAQYIETLLSDNPREGWRNGLEDASVALSLQHLWRIGRSTGTIVWSGGIAYVNNKLEQTARTRITTQAFAQWHRIHRHWLQAQQNDMDGSDVQEEDTRPRLPNVEALGGSQPEVPPCFAAHVADLPRNMPVEWWSFGLSSSSVRQCYGTTGTAVSFSTCCLLSTTRITWVGVRYQELDSMQSLIAQVQTASAITIWSVPPLPAWLTEEEVQFVPCFEIRNERQEQLAAVLLVVQYSADAP